MVLLNNYKVIFLFFNLLAFSCTFTFANQDDAFSFFPSLSAAEKEPYTNWLDDKASSYDRHTFLPSTADADLGAAVLWKIDETNEMITFAVAVKATGWLGFGISEAGGMLGSDIVLFRASDNSLVDSHVLEAFYPITDDCQNWNLVSSSTDDGWIMIETSRKLDTGDRQDHKIMNDEMLWVAPHRLISAWGDTEDVEYHGNNRGRITVRLFLNSSSNSSLQALREFLEARSDGYFEVREANYEIPTQTTTYHEVCKTFSEVLEEISEVLEEKGVENQDTLTMLGAIPVISEETAPYVHHFVVSTQASCGGYDPQREMVYGWAPGDDGYALPEGIGFPLFETNNKEAMVVEIHYDNPNEDEGKLDSSGLRFYYSLEEQSQSAGLLQLGDPFVNLNGEGIFGGLSKYEFTCPEACSKSFLDSRGVTVLTESLHMHKAGVRMTNEVIRGGDVVHTSRVDVFEFDQQGTFHVPQSSYQLYPGDAFRTTCYYRDGSEFGLGSDEEMCIAYIMYYPAKKLPFFGFPWLCSYGIEDYFSQCSEDLIDSELKDDAELEREFGVAGECAANTPSSAPASKFPTHAPTNAYHSHQPSPASSNPSLSTMPTLNNQQPSPTSLNPSLSTMPTLNNPTVTQSPVPVNPSAPSSSSDIEKPTSSSALRPSENMWMWSIFVSIANLFLVCFW